MSKPSQVPSFSSSILSISVDSRINSSGLNCSSRIWSILIRYSLPLYSAMPPSVNLTFGQEVLIKLKTTSQFVPRIIDILVNYRIELILYRPRKFIGTPVHISTNADERPSEKFLKHLIPNEKKRLAQSTPPDISTGYRWSLRAIYAVNGITNAALGVQRQSGRQERQYRKANLHPTNIPFNTLADLYLFDASEEAQCSFPYRNQMFWGLMAVLAWLAPFRLRFERRAPLPPIARCARHRHI